MRQIRLTVEKISKKRVYFQVEALTNGTYEVVDSFSIPTGAAEVPVGATAVIYPDDFES